MKSYRTNNSLLTCIHFRVSNFDLMKNLTQTLIISISLFLVSCGTEKLIMSAEEISEKGYSLENWNILKNGEIVGVLSNTEWELYNGQLTKEISIKTSFTSDEDMKEIARFVYAKFPDCKIEVNDDGGNSFPK